MRYSRTMIAADVAEIVNTGSNFCVREERGSVALGVILVLGCWTGQMGHMFASCGALGCWLGQC